MEQSDMPLLLLGPSEHERVLAESAPASSTTMTWATLSAGTSDGENPAPDGTAICSVPARGGQPSAELRQAGGRLHAVHPLLSAGSGLLASHS